MMRTLYTGASGLKSHQVRMDVIGKNMSNVNTVGYKSSRTTFEDLLSQNIKGASASGGAIGSTDPRQIGLGAKVSATDVTFKDGTPVVTGKKTDLCLSGDGLFVVKRGNENYYTRDGAFEFDSVGNYVLPGSGDIVQGWIGKRGVIDTTNAIQNINIVPGKPLIAATDLVTYVENLSADVPVVTGITIPSSEPLNIGFGGKSVRITGIPADGKTWVFTNDVKLGATSAEINDGEGNTETVTLLPAATFEIPGGTNVDFHYLTTLTKGSVSAKYPLTLRIDGKEYTAVAMDNDLDFTTRWTLKSGSALAGNNTITVTNGSTDVTLTLKTALEESIGQVDVTEAVADESHPAIVTFSDGTTAVKTEGTYAVGSSLPIASSATVYDTSEKVHDIPFYFIRKADENSDGTWLVSLSPDVSVTKGQTATSEVTDADGNRVSVSFDAAEIKFDSAGNLITDSDSDTAGTLKLGDQNVAVDFTGVTQHSGETTINSTSNGGVVATLKDFQIDSYGIITGIYTNGATRPEAQVAMAHFNNSEGLLKTGTSLYQESNDSGTPVIIKAGEFGVVITPGALEMSNVDLANEFSDMIITQRGFQANSKLITVGDEMIETAVNMKR